MLDRTTPNHADSAVFQPLAIFKALISVGTGGDYTAAYHLLREGKSLFRGSRIQSNGFAVGLDLEHAKSVLSLTMTEVAHCLGVSRQAIYNWISGGSIKPENLSKLIELKSAADVIAGECLPERALFLRRKLPGGKTLLETIAAGGDGTTAARALVRLANQEVQQRASLAKLFAGRRMQDSLGPEIPKLNES